MAKNCESIVPNDADFTENEPFAFLLGANGGGKTTYLRALGVNLIFFLAGCPVFAKEAEIYPFDIVLSHFPKDERFDNTGRLDEERGRTEKMLDAARGKRAFVFFNETYRQELDETFEKMYGMDMEEYTNYMLSLPTTSEE